MAKHARMTAGTVAASSKIQV